MQAATSSVPHPSNTSPLRVLLVEDNDSDALVAQAAVEKALRGPREILRAVTLADGLAAIRSVDVDLVLLDLNLPDSRGVNTLKRMRVETTCPIIVVTVDDRPGLDEEALGSGAFEILHKGRLGPDAIARLLRLAEDRRRGEAALERTRSRLELALAASRVCTWDYDVRSGEVLLSESWAEIVGAPPGEIRTTARARTALVHPDDLAALEKQLTDAMKGLSSEYAVEHRVRHRSGEWRWVATHGKVIERDAHGRAVRLAGTNLDITQRKRAEERLRESEARFRSLTELSSDWYWEQDENFRFQFSDSIENHGSTPAAHYGKTRWELPALGVSEEQWAEHRAVLEAHQPFRDFEYQRLSENGYAIWMSESGTPIFDERGSFKGYRGIGRNITDRMRAEARLAHLAQFDRLTGLPNRNLLGERLEQAITQARRHGRGAGVLFIDLDQFKLINDTLGHAAGDELLDLVAKRLTQCVRPDDTVGRLSGDEFAVVIADLSRADDAAIVAQKIIESFTAPFDLFGEEAFVTLSIGVAAFPNDGDGAGVLLNCADTAMSRAKESSRNAFCFYAADMNARAASKLHLHTDLRHAIDRGEFQLHYQPKVELTSGAMIGMEALIRWQHPVRGMISPAEFIPALEDTGLIIPVGDWVVEEARAQLRKWTLAGLAPIPIAINLSAKQFRRRDLDQVICRLLAEYGVSPHLLELEITESCLMDDPKDAVRQLGALREAGFTISMDDFGTGYSSLAYLTRLPLSTLKIDRSFVNAAISDSGSATIVKMVIDMAQDLHLNVVAEGIETGSQVDFLRQRGCEQGQGYHFGRPMTAEAIAPRLARLGRPSEGSPGH